MTNPFIRMGLAMGIIRQHQAMPNGQSAAVAAVARAAAPASAQQPSASNSGHVASAASTNPQGAARAQTQPQAGAASAAQQQQQPRHESAPATSQGAPAQPAAAAPSQPQPLRSPVSQPVTAARALQPAVSTSLSGGAIAAVRTDIMQAVERGRDIDTIFPIEATFKGELEIDQHFVINGVFRGSINQTGVHSLLIGNTGGVHGNVRGHQLIVGGTIEGDVCANEVIVLETGKIIGNVTYEKLAVELGGEVNGRTQKEVFNVVVGQSSNAQSAEPAAAPLPASDSAASPGNAGSAWQAPEPVAPTFGGLHAVPTQQSDGYGLGGVSGDQNREAGTAHGQMSKASVA